MKELIFTMEETNKFGMYESTLDCLDRNKERDSQAPALAEAREGLRGKITDLSSTAQQKKVRTGKVEVKDSAQNSLVEAAYSVISALSAYAFKSKNSELKSKVDFSHSDLVRMRDVTLSETAKAILTLGSENKNGEDAQKCGLTAAKLTALETQLTSFNAAKKGIYEGGTVRSSAVKALEAKFKDVDNYLTSFVDKLVDGLKNEFPGFYNEYYAARVIRDLGGSHKKNGETPGQPPNQPK